MKLTVGLRKVFVLAAIAALVVGLYAIIGFFVVPHAVHSQILEFARTNYQREPTIGKVRFNPFTLTLEIRGFSFPDEDAKPLFGFERLVVNSSLSSIWRRGPSLELIELDQPFGRVVIRPDGTLNFADLAKPFEKEQPEPESEPTRVFIDLLRVIRGRVDIEDHTRPTPFHAQLQPVTFALREFSTVGTGANSYALDAESTAGGKFTWNGTFDLKPVAAKGQFALIDVPTRTLWSYLRDSLAFKITDGAVTLDGHYDFSAPESGVNLVVGLENVDVRELGVAPRGEADEEYVHLTHLNLRDSRFDLANSRVEFGAIKLAGGEVRARRDSEGRINLLQLVEQPPAADAPQQAANESSAPAESAAPEAEPEWLVSAPDITVEQLKIALEDRFVKPTAAFELNPVTFHVKGFSTQPDQLYDVDGNIALASGGHVELQGQALPERGSFRGKVVIANIDLKQFQPYVATYSQLTLLDGAVSADLDIERGDDASLRIAGDTRVNNFHSVDTAMREDFAKWERLEVDRIDYKSSPAPGSLSIATINAQSPYIRFIISPDQTTNVSKIMTAPASAPGPVQTVKTTANEPAPENPQPMKMRIGRVNIRNGSGNFADFWIQPNYAVSIQQLSGAISGLSSDPASRAKLKLDGKIDRYAPASIEGEVNLLSASLFTDLKVNFKGVELSSVTPYSGRFAGYRIEKGKLSVDLEYHVENRKLDAKQQFVIDQLQLGDKVDSPDAVKLPLKLAVALLKDSNGVIDLGLPVSGSLDDPQFRLGPIIWKAFVGLLTKAATAPFKLLGAMFGGGDEEMNLIVFEPGSPTLDDAGKQRLAGMVKALKERPGLQLDIPAVYSDVDGMAIANQAMAAGNPGTSGSAGESSDDPNDRFEQLVEQFRAEFGPKATLPGSVPAVLDTRAKKRDPQILTTATGELEQALREKHAATPEQLEALGQARARAIQDALLGSGEIDPQRVFLIAAEAKPAVDGKVRVELALK
jgi:hypothetical protein